MQQEEEHLKRYLTAGYQDDESAPRSQQNNGVTGKNFEEGLECDDMGQSQLVVHAPQTPLRSNLSKRAHPTTPDELDRCNGQIRTKHTAIVPKKGKGNVEGKPALTCPEISLITNGRNCAKPGARHGYWLQGPLSTLESITEQWR